ncbi:ABC transporter permease subunit [Kytococcus sedentarius]|uniref:Amino acid ABC transporter membrane protein n=1 Tax=Kytococcus sedentarius (strain ATCC 14392 / DSM 20547 / JCM 11482 / CCUG 33030 / NBRC 15357 / NCTC 11040 / CCM 314 / 541) TaxID=478801 RepID=C7NLF8_KYTSD|nr:ABC transporter permease subunit [Kytococcus sedentarius]ACV07154.1 amino acid ABC transporter membrane protein [Kytococcus sedentarius DSM 20547]QQB63136.1 ABC transporter permease subunit [Kytococcus sedentarius]QRO86934.1 ABC transporter permease subunit [Kytococcus sedentarius]STX14014.1 Arginine transport system permease protein ArtQ [Kytococcus sedentarius]
MNELWDNEVALEALPVMLEAFVKVTLVVTVIGSLVAAVLGLVWAVSLRELPAVVGKPLGWALDVVRMTPLPLQLLFVYFTFNQLSGMVVGIVVMGIHYSTYMAESYRAGIESVPRGQWEAATALSLPARRTWTDLIIPQALRNTLPSLGGWAIAMFKDTPFLIVIGVPEMVTAAQRVGAQNFTYTEALTIAGAIFLVASYPTFLLMRYLEKKLEY